MNNSSVERGVAGLRDSRGVLNVEGSEFWSRVWNVQGLGSGFWSRVWDVHGFGSSWSLGLIQVMYRIMPGLYSGLHIGLHVGFGEYGASWC